MTHPHLKWARAQKVGNLTAQFVLEELAYRARPGSNECVVSHRVLADRLQTTVKTIQRAMKRLSSGCYISRSRRTNKHGYRISDCYEVLVDEMSARPNGQNGQSYQSNCPVHLPDKMSRESSLTTFEKPIAKERKKVGASLEVEPFVAATADQNLEKRQALAVSLAEILKPESSNLALPQAEKIITAQIADFGEATVKQALGRLRTRLLGGETIPKPARILQLICEDIRRERRERSDNPYAEHGVSRWG